MAENKGVEGGGVTQECCVLEVVEYDTETVVHTVDVSKLHPRQIDLAEGGLMRNMNLARYYIRRQVGDRTLTHGDKRDG